MYPVIFCSPFISLDNRFSDFPYNSKMPLKIVKQFQDQQLMRRLKNRDREAFIKVYDENVKEIHRFVYFKVGRKDEADDLTSLIFLKAWHHIQNKSLEDAKTLRALLYKIARNAIIDYYRDKANKTTSSLDDGENKIEIIDESFDLPADLDRARELDLIRKQLPRLKDEYRELIIMRFVNDLELEEIAEISGKSKGNVRVSLHRALSSLKDLVDGRNVNPLKNGAKNKKNRREK